ncbi:MAG: cytochrome c [Nitrospirota bacterium]
MSIYLMKPLAFISILILMIVAIYAVGQYETLAAAQIKGGAPGDSSYTASQDSIIRGKNIFKAKCIFCHDPHSTGNVVGPGLKGILKKQELPASGRPATPENIRKQLSDPFDRMPSFDYLSKDEQDDIIAYLSTL